MRSYPCWIAGLRYRAQDGTDRGRYCRNLKVGSRLQLVPEPTNRYSDKAVAIVHQDRHLGYIPDRHDWIADAIAESKQLSCDIDRIEIKGLLFRRASFVGLRITVESDPAVAAYQAHAEQRRHEKLARQACADGLKVLAYIAMADGEVTPAESRIEVAYIESRLTAVGIWPDASLTDAMLALSQGLVVSTRGLTRAINAVARDREHFKLLLGSALRIADLGNLKDAELEAFEKLQKAGQARGWI
jgi:hypothetical protein